MDPVVNTGLQPISAVVVLLIGEQRVEALLKALVGRPEVPNRWFVVGTDMEELDALNTHWAQIVDLTIIGVPEGVLIDADPVTQILHAEGLRPGDCQWLVTREGLSAPLSATLVRDVAANLSGTLGIH